MKPLVQDNLWQVPKGGEGGEGGVIESKEEAGAWSHLEESLSVTDEKPIGLRLVLAVKGVKSKTLLLKTKA